ncbi:hypothetical protein HSB1_32540 [Halogranum salarium B-1]|uniref:Uncharacterized protein n=1 Tax=Halogranum salarium B-1 TaxID=1210908 RepID=J3EU58_9EURY|nr:hypothetical protein HSB1_32540 [Halogranum salarium B-1]
MSARFRSKQTAIDRDGGVLRRSGAPSTVEMPKITRVV